MTQPMTLARPYARALFAVSQKGGDAMVSQWQRVLDALGLVVEHIAQCGLIGHPKLQAELLSKICMDSVLDACGSVEKQVREQLDSLLQLLVKRKRLTLVPEMAKQFSNLSSEAAGVVNATITSHAPLSAAQKKLLTQALEKRLSCQVSVTCEEDPALLGGAVVRVGDWVVDHTVRRHLNRLEALLT